MEIVIRIICTCQEQWNSRDGLQSISLPSRRIDFVTFDLVVASCSTPQERTVVPFVFSHLFTFSLALTTFFLSGTHKWHNMKSKQLKKCDCMREVV